MEKKIELLTPKQMIQRLLIAIAQVIAGNASKNLLNEIQKSYTLCVEQKKLLKNNNELNNVIKQNRYYI